MSATKAGPSRAERPSGAHAGSGSRNGGALEETLAWSRARSHRAVECSVEEVLESHRPPPATRPPHSMPQWHGTTIRRHRSSTCWAARTPPSSSSRTATRSRGPRRRCRMRTLDPRAALHARPHPARDRRAHRRLGSLHVARLLRRALRRLETAAARRDHRRPLALLAARDAQATAAHLHPDRAALAEERTWTRSQTRLTSQMPCPPIWPIAGSSRPISGWTMWPPSRTSQTRPSASCHTRSGRPRARGGGCWRAPRSPRARSRRSAPRGRPPGRGRAPAGARRAAGHGHRQLLGVRRRLGQRLAEAAPRPCRSRSSRANVLRAVVRDTTGWLRRASAITSSGSASVS